MFNSKPIEIYIVKIDFECHWIPEKSLVDWLLIKLIFAIVENIVTSIIVWYACKRFKGKLTPWFVAHETLTSSPVGGFTERNH